MSAHTLGVSFRGLGFALVQKTLDTGAQCADTAVIATNHEPDTMLTSTAAEHIAQASAYLNDFGLPNVRELVESVRELRSYIQAVDPYAWANDPRLTRADRIIDQYEHKI